MIVSDKVNKKVGFCLFIVIINSMIEKVNKKFLNNFKLDVFVINLVI